MLCAADNIFGIICFWVLFFISHYIKCFFQLDHSVCPSGTVLLFNLNTPILLLPHGNKLKLHIRKITARQHLIELHFYTFFCVVVAICTTLAFADKSVAKVAKMETFYLKSLQYLVVVPSITSARFLSFIHLCVRRAFANDLQLVWQQVAVVIVFAKIWL